MSLNPNSVALGFITDRSGSMEVMNPVETCGSLNEVIKDQVKTGKDIRVWFSSFDHKYEMVHANAPASEVTITQEQIEPRGSTALYDAMYYFITQLGEQLTVLQERPSKVIVIILTDGEENTSKIATRNQVMEMVKHQQEKYNWEFVFMGANQDAIGNGADIGINRDAACDFNYSQEGCSAALRTVSNAVTRTISGQTPQIQFTDAERLESQCIIPDDGDDNIIEDADEIQRTSSNVPSYPKYYLDDDSEPRRTNGGNRFNRMSNEARSDLDSMFHI